MIKHLKMIKPLRLLAVTFMLAIAPTVLTGPKISKIDK